MKKILVGGQAVIEGVMMKSPNYIATSVRKPNGKIITTVKKHVSWTKKPVLKWPFIRGVVSMIEMLSTGLKSLTWSSNQALDESDDKFSTWELVISLALAVLFALVMFKLLPLGIAELFKKGLGVNNLLYNLIDGIIKATIFVLYLAIISKLKDMKRIFAYHGAEHKTIHCFETGKELNVKNVKKYSTAHTRCGTTFILSVLVLSIIIYIFIPFTVSFWQKYLLRILLLPVIMGVSYEFMKLTSKFHHFLLFRIIAAPGLWLQSLTTNPPDDKQIEVALTSLKAVLKKEKIL